VIEANKNPGIFTAVWIQAVWKQIVIFLGQFKSWKPPSFHSVTQPSRSIFRRCVAEDLPFADGSADLVTAMSAFHWFDRPRFLQEAHRILKPRGCLALLNYTMDMRLSSPDRCSDSLNRVCNQVLAEIFTREKLLRMCARICVCDWSTALIICPRVLPLLILLFKPVFPTVTRLLHLHFTVWKKTPDIIFLYTTVQKFGVT